MHEARAADRTPVHYTMKAPHTTRPSPGPIPSHGKSHSRSSSYNKKSGRSSKPTTPIASPYPVDRAHTQPPPQPPKLSPGRTPEARAPSPNYFGLIPESSLDPRDSSLLPRDNWSSPTSSVKSFGAAIPKQVSIDANPDYEAFKKQADANRGDSFALSTSHFGLSPSNPGIVRPRPPQRWHTHASETSAHFGAPRGLKETPSVRMDVDRDSNYDSAYVSAESKRNSEASMHPPPMTLNLPRFQSPRPMDIPPERRTTLSKVDDRHPRLSMTQNKADPPPSSLHHSSHQRAETEPGRMESGPSLISPSQLKQMLEDPQSDTNLLILDLRVTQQYLHARVDQALNLCTPTTLLKRATFNLERLKQTFQSPADKERFSKWASTKNLVVYDAHSADKRDAVACMNMIKKFTNEGYQGGTSILRGGFNAFYAAFPDLIKEGSATDPAAAVDTSATASDGGRLGIPPVMGGVMLPQASGNPNPFFSNIRQNMDLADGVGQLDIARPGALDSPTLPRWLRDAATVQDHGKQVSDKFLHIEKDEQQRMKKAYSIFNPGTKSANPSTPIQLSGIEKGVKNRYKDILPFDHSRVKLQGRPTGACDYVNASHIKASGSNKRYIASQGPLPATFEDFWSVVWDQDVRVIVMLTAESEGGQLKCHPYWKSNDFGPIRLKLLSEKKVSLDIDKHRSSSHAVPGSSSSSSMSSAESGRRRANTTTMLESSTAPSQPPPTQGESPYVIIRKFAMSHASHPFAPIREITHLHYPSWPDFGAPAQPSHLLGLVELANVMQRAALPVDTPSVAASGPATEALPLTFYDEPEDDARARPMLVHCSAGCGRTGTFCTVDSVIDMLKRQRLAKTTLKPVRKRDSDGDIKMSGERQVAEPVSPRTAQEKAFSLSPPHRHMSIDVRRCSWEGPPLETNWLGDEGVDLISKTVEDFRSQRLSMVQSLRQFVLCYETVIEYVWRMQERNNVTFSTGTGTGRTRARSGSLQVNRDG